ncbi:MAG: dethiobiotin synthase, partial [Candidatus Tantalella remota]|nr:dethiobiotin synthase [Candidatus Tantalella remota]
MANSIFITGTDTGVGKTVVTGLLGGYLSDKGINVVTQKWVQTGCEAESSDMARHLELMKKDKGDFLGFIRDMVPYNLLFPASPHLAARKEKIDIDPEKIVNSFRRLEAGFNTVLVEGVGGAKVPLNKETLIVDIAQELRLPVLIVAENRLGTINHTLLTIEAIKNRKLPILGIVFNRSSEDGDP